MKMAYLVLALISGLLGVQSTMARTMVMKPGTMEQQLAAPKPHSVMSMGKIEAIDLNARKIRINAVDYSFAPGTRFSGISGAALQPAQLKAGDWIHFWIKPETNQHTPVIERVDLLANPEMGKTKP